MSRHLGSVSAVRRSRAYRSIARVVIAAQLLTLLPSAATSSAAQASGRVARHRRCRSCRARS